jgi:hypothetical protein
MPVAARGVILFMVIPLEAFFPRCQFNNKKIQFFSVSIALKLMQMSAIAKLVKARASYL